MEKGYDISCLCYNDNVIANKFVIKVQKSLSEKETSINIIKIITCGLVGARPLAILLAATQHFQLLGPVASDIATTSSTAPYGGFFIALR